MKSPGGTYRTSYEPFASYLDLGERKSPFIDSDFREPPSYVEGLNDARTTMADFFNSLLLVQLPGDGVGLQASPCR